MDRFMRAARFHGPGTEIKIEEVPYPLPGPGEVVVRVAACGICGTDVHFLEGMPVPGGLPFTLGHEPSGIVETIGAGVRGWQPGDRVALHLGAGCGTCRACTSGHPNCCPHLTVPGLHIDGAFAEAIRVPVGSLVRVPERVSLAAAALATDCVASPYHALACRAALRQGERLAVIGCGGLGGQAVSLGRVLGASQVVAVDVSRVALERAAREGATHRVDASSESDAAGAVRDLTGGGADVAIECVGTPETVAAGVRALAPGGRLVVVGVGMMPPAVGVPQATFAVQELSILGSFGSHQRDLEEVLRLQADGAIDIEASISHRLRLDQVAEGLEMLRTRRGDPRRIVVEIPVG
ncbi:MAG TPA: zinc-binding dehydrogenase [Candidatus Binataceae bacterium]|nr:zinc-binding dehydrogenase [Candidatus Binataceae bacterium]